MARDGGGALVLGCVIAQLDRGERLRDRAAIGLGLVEQTLLSLTGGDEYQQDCEAHLDVLLDLGFELAARHGADQLTDDAATLEDEERRNRPYAILLGDDL